MVMKNDPLSEPSFYVLLSLAEPLHGYGIIKKVEDLSDGRIRLGPGTLYGALTKMVKMGWIKPLPVENGERRKAYALTIEGAALLQKEVSRITEQIKHGTAALRAWENRKPS